MPTHRSQAYALDCPRPPRAKPLPATRRTFSERELVAVKLSMAMALCRWSDGMLARAIGKSKNFARMLRLGYRTLGADDIARLLRFERFGAVLRAQGVE